MPHLLAAVLNTDLYLWPWGQAPRKNVAETSPGGAKFNHSLQRENSNSGSLGCEKFINKYVITP